MVQEEIESLKKKSVAFPHRMLTIICRQLAVNAEENYQFEDASNFRYMAMEAQRRDQFPGLAFGRLSFWYWVASGFGERVLRACLILLGIWLLAGLFYTRVGFAFPEPKRRIIVLPTTSPFLRWNQISLALGDDPGYVAVGGIPPELFAPAEIEVMRRASAKMTPALETQSAMHSLSA